MAKIRRKRCSLKKLSAVARKNNAKKFSKEELELLEYTLDLI